MRINEKNYNKYLGNCKMLGNTILSFEEWTNLIFKHRKERRKQKNKDWRLNNKAKLRGYNQTYRQNKGSRSAGISDSMPEPIEEIDDDLKEKYGDRAGKAQVLKDWGESEEKIAEAMNDQN